MKERPILMSGDNPRLILEGRKTQTRRIVKPQPIRQHHIVEAQGQAARNMDGAPQFEVRTHFATTHAVIQCPYGVAGDRLWVRETHYAFGAWKRNGLTKTGKQKWKFIHCFPEMNGRQIQFPGSNTEVVKGKGQRGYFKRVSIHMPRWASRITLEILKVRVERLQDISEEDAEAEGIDSGYLFDNGIRTSTPFVSGYRHLWDSLHGKGAWDKNPWVWVLEFKKT
jgi:hypothetical protein